MVIIDGDTGEIVFRKNGQKDELGVNLSDDEIKFIKSYKGRKISLYNHPTNLLPTGSDYASMGYRGYEIGLIVTHDGRVFRYGVGPEAFRSVEFDIILETMEKNMYNVIDDGMYEKLELEVLERFRKEKGIICIEI